MMTADIYEVLILSHAILGAFKQHSKASQRVTDGFRDVSESSETP